MQSPSYKNQPEFQVQPNLGMKRTVYRVSQLNWRLTGFLTFLLISDFCEWSDRINIRFPIESVGQVRFLKQWLIQYIIFSELSYLYLLFWKCFKFFIKNVLNLVFFFFKGKHIAFYIRLLYNVRYFVNNVMYYLNLFLVLFTNGPSSIHLNLGIAILQHLAWPTPPCLTRLMWVFLVPQRWWGGRGIGMDFDF